MACFGALLVFLCAGGCGSVDGPSRNVALDRAFDLKVGETVTVEDQLLTLTFNGVTSDSRCPLGVLCIQAGDAVVSIGAVRLPSHRGTVDLHGGPGQPDGGRFQDFNLSLVELSPPRRMNAAIAPGDYVATLVVSR
jgi:hypothetical protein